LLQNIGLVFLTLGSILLSLNVFKYNLQKYINYSDWKKVPWEVRIFCRLFLGIKDRDQYIRKLFLIHPIPSSDDKLDYRQRLTIDIPIIALILMIIGMLLCFNFSALFK
jgi:hypothetical protein